MTAAAFQLALAELVASPVQCLEIRERPTPILERYDLSEREKRRLVCMVRQPGMSTNCTLYRSNRVTPIYTLLQSTCFVLGDLLGPELDEYWAHFDFDDLQFKQEIERFGNFLKHRIAAGKLEIPILAEVLDFDLAWNALRFSPRRRILRELALAQACSGVQELRLHPLVRVVRLRHEPHELLRRLAERLAPPYDLAQGEFFLLLSAVDEALLATPIDAPLGRLLLAIDAGVASEIAYRDCVLLLQAALVVARESSRLASRRATTHR